MILMILMTEDGRSKILAAILIGGALGWGVLSGLKQSRTAEKLEKKQAEGTPALPDQEAQP